MKYFSSDFIALYNSAMTQYSAEQKKIDKKYEAIIEELVSREAVRLESTVPRPFSHGDFVETIDGRVGEVIDCPIVVELKVGSGYFEEPAGPNRYLPLKSEEDEVVATCEGMIRKVTVRFKPSDLELDWGRDEVVHSFYPDELSAIKKK